MVDKSSHSKQPNYRVSKEKQAARQAIVDAYQFFLKRKTIPKDRIYITLCNEQDQMPGSEIVQMMSLGFLKPCQFFGVDNNAEIIQRNKQNHPDAHWFHGDWSNVVMKLSDDGLFNPSLIYYDCIHTVSSKPGVAIIAETMNLCHEKNILFAANVALQDGHSIREYDENYLVEHVWDLLLPKQRDSWKSFDADTNLIFEYKTRKASMATHIFYRRKK